MYYIKIKNNNSFLYKLLARGLYEKIYIDYSVIIGKDSKIGKQLLMPHLQNIVIGEFVKIGDSCCIVFVSIMRLSWRLSGGSRYVSIWLN